MVQWGWGSVRIWDQRSKHDKIAIKTWWNWDQNMMKYHLYLDKVLQVSVQKIWFSRLLPRPVLPVRCLAREAPGASLRHLFLFQHRVPRKGGTFIAAMRNHEVWGWGSGVKVYIGAMEPWGMLLRFRGSKHDNIWIKTWWNWNLSEVRRQILKWS